MLSSIMYVSNIETAQRLEEAKLKFLKGYNLQKVSGPLLVGSTVGESTDIESLLYSRDPMALKV